MKYYSIAIILLMAIGCKTTQTTVSNDVAPPVQPVEQTPLEVEEESEEDYYHPKGLPGLQVKELRLASY